MNPTKEELDEAIANLKLLIEGDWKLSRPIQKTALTILTRYRDGELVEKEDEKQNEMWESVIDYLFTGTNATPKDSWKRIVQEDYILLKRPSPPTDQTECERCNGTGLVGMTIRTDNGDFDADDQPCPDCKPLKP